MSASPRASLYGAQGERACYIWSPGESENDIDLPCLVGRNGLGTLLTHLDPGAFHSNDYHGPDVSNIREFVDVIKRLHIPYYEEARQYLHRANDFCDGVNEVQLAHGDFLRELIEWSEANEE
jgi:hypothetical protein